jgi:hypothetical protein
MRTRARFSPRRKALLAAVLLLLGAMFALRMIGVAGFNGTQPREMDWNDDGVATRDEILQGYTIIAIHETREGARTCRHYARLRDRSAPFRVECRVEFGKPDGQSAQ